MFKFVEFARIYRYTFVKIVSSQLDTNEKMCLQGIILFKFVEFAQIYRYTFVKIVSSYIGH